MSITAEPAWITTEELLAMPEDDGVERELVRGELKEKPMTRRNPRHGLSEATIATLLNNWLRRHPDQGGKVYSGEIGVRLRRNPDTTVGIDVAYFSAETVAANRDADSLIEGAPILAVEILSPSDRQEDILDKVREYLACGVKLVWVAEPVFRTLCGYRPDAEPVMFSASQQLSGDPHLANFACTVSDLFGE